LTNDEKSGILYIEIREILRHKKESF
jgi:hypothetical protein